MVFGCSAAASAETAYPKIKLEQSTSVCVLVLSPEGTVLVRDKARKAVQNIRVRVPLR